MNPVDHDYLKYYRIPKGSILVDVGASVGEWGSEILPQLKEAGALLVCMEPAPWCIERLAKWVNEESFGFATILSAALTWSLNGPVGLKIADSYLISHLDSLPGNPMERWGGKPVRTDPVVGMTLESLARIFGQIGMVKMDIEGAEVPAIVNTADFVLDHIDNFTIAAYHDYEGRKTWEILQPFLESKGYKTIHECVPYKDFPAMDMLYATKDGSF